MGKPKILFIGSLWLDQKEELGVTNAEHYLWNTYGHYGGEHTRFSFDEHFKRHGEPGDKALLELAEEFKPDIIFLDWHLASNQNPTPETLRELNLIRKIPIIAIWWDHVWIAHIKMAEIIQYWVDLNVVVDSGSFFPKAQEPEKYIFLWTPQDKDLYYPQDKTQEIGFFGRIKKPGRKEIIEKLKQDVPGFIHGAGRRENPVSKEEYAKAYRSTAMVLNFSESNSKEDQLVGRVFEATLSGCLLLQQMSTETAGMFTPNIDYVEWREYDDLLKTIKYFQENRDEMRLIAETGQRKAAKYYNSDVWWDTVLRAL